MVSTWWPYYHGVDLLAHRRAYERRGFGSRSQRCQLVKLRVRLRGRLFALYVLVRFLSLFFGVDDEAGGGGFCGVGFGIHFFFAAPAGGAFVGVDAAPALLR